MKDLPPQNSRPERIHLHVGPLCNNDCVFCVEDDRELRFVVNAAMTESRTRELLEAHQGTPEVYFTSGEPTLLEELPALGQQARELGYGRIGLMTNGRRLGSPGYARDLLDAGFNAFLVGLHGPDAELHDRLVGREGAFDQTVAGLRALLAGADDETRICTSTVVVRPNVDRLGELYGLLAGMGVSAVRLDGLAARGRVLLAMDELFPSYEQLQGQIRAILAEGLAPGTELELANLPPCITVEFEPHHVRKLAEYTSFEVEDGSPSPLARSVGKTSADGRFRILEAGRIDAQGRVKGEPCGGCRYEPTCQGVYESYAARHGWGEFVPVPPASDLH
ncbi:MAG: radical SAM protein [Deltaproteobacteria bacterium]|nr:radical SAM protein [Deltaproteobacteria bacterium]